MESLTKQSEDQLSSEFTEDVIPTIDVDSDRKTLRSTFETINFILQHGEIHIKVECVNRIIKSACITDPKQAKIYEKAVMKTKVLQSMLYLMKYEDYNDLIFKNDDTYTLNITMAGCMWELSHYYAALGEVIAEAGGISYFTDICRFKPFLDNLENPLKFDGIDAFSIVTKFVGNQPQMNEGTSRQTEEHIGSHMDGNFYSLGILYSDGLFSLLSLPEMSQEHTTDLRLSGNSSLVIAVHIYRFIEALVATLHNIARLAPVSQLVRESKTAEAMVPLFSCEKEKLRILATLAAAETCDDSEVNMLFDAEGVISSILKYLNQSTKVYNYYYTLMELLGGIDKLACADTNKKKILEAGALPLFEAILNLDKPEEQALTARVCGL